MNRVFLFSPSLPSFFPSFLLSLPLSLSSFNQGNCWLKGLTVSVHCALVALHQLCGEGNGNPLQCSCLENPRDGGAWWASVYGVTQSQTGLK